MSTFNIGCHLSIAAGYKNMGLAAISIGAKTCQFFSRNPRGSTSKIIEISDAAALLEIAKANNFAKLLVHAPYTMNACSINQATRELAHKMMSEDIAVAERLIPNNLYNFHPGCHLSQGVTTGISLIADMLNNIITQSQSTIILLETMSGKGTEIGSSFEEINNIIKQVKVHSKIGVCLDTCHVFSAGYDIVNHLDQVLNEFDKIIGLKKLHAIHLNDSMTPFGSRKDRHAKIGEGTIGIDAIKRIINHSALRNLPFFLETPNDLLGHQKEITLLKAMRLEESQIAEICSS